MEPTKPRSCKGGVVLGDAFQVNLQGYKFQIQEMPTGRWYWSLPMASLVLILVPTGIVFTMYKLKMRLGAVQVGFRSLPWVGGGGQSVGYFFEVTKESWE